MYKLPNKHECWDCMCHAWPGQNQLKIEDMYHWSFHYNCFNDSGDESSHSSLFNMFGYSKISRVWRCIEGKKK